MVSLIGISFNLATWITHRVARKAVSLMPEETLEIIELKNTMTTELDKISEQVGYPIPNNLFHLQSYSRVRLMIY